MDAASVCRALKPRAGASFLGMALGAVLFGAGMLAGLAHAVEPLRYEHWQDSRTGWFIARPTGAARGGNLVLTRN